MKCRILEKEGDITGAFRHAATHWVALPCAALQVIPGCIGVSERSGLTSNLGVMLGGGGAERVILHSIFQLGFLSWKEHHVLHKKS